jgi:predicted DNA-binding transcriptional regulator YafY
MQDNGLLVTLKLRHEEDAVQWLLGWGAHVRVLEPVTLRDRLIAEAQRMIDRYKSG